MDFIETNEKYHSGFVVQEYRGTWSLVSARQYETRDGEMKTALRFGEIEIGKDRTAKLPVAVEIGSTKQEAIETLRIVLMHLDGKPANVHDYDDSVPF